MRDAGGLKPVFLSDYQPPAFLVDETRLDISLQPERTRVDARLQLRRNPARTDRPADCWLDGEQLALQQLAIDGVALAPERYELSDKGLLLRDVPADFVLETSVEINPQANTALEGLYISHGMFCTQCEAQGFRRITFFPDRPDVLSRFTTTVRGDKSAYPLLLSNGNPVAQGEENGTHFVTWEDPFPKPCYLFALVAGDLACLEDSFTTSSGRVITLKIFAEARDLDKLDHAMTSLKHAMEWDEKTFGREYDLDLFMIVAVSHFNMGAMENKGLNVFNTSCVLAHPATTSDAGFQRVESVVGHEYFHNWSGNRVTCRDWFQLSLKEGFTVFRDQEFSADMNSRAVKRVEDVSFLRSHQFPEDQGPMAHPVRPASYQKIDNFYTLTVYEKGAEVVRMQSRLLGAEKFRAATDDYFARFDGQAVTCDDFVACMARASGMDLEQFKRWYSQAGTPRVSARGQFVEGVYRLTLTQQTDQPPLVIPVALALLGKQGKLPLNAAGDQETLLLLTEPEQTFEFALAETPVPSLLRGFSAPVLLDYAYSEAELAQLLVADDDGFCRWDAAQRLYADAIEHLMSWPEALDERVQRLAPVLGALFFDAHKDPATTALLLAQPAETVIGDRFPIWLPQEVHLACERLKRGLAKALYSSLWGLVTDMATPGAYRPVADDIAKRSLRWCALGYLASLRDEKVAAELLRLFKHADNMTDELSALTLLCHYDLPQAEAALTQFAARWKDEALVMDKWFAVQATRPDAATLATVQRLLDHEQFELTLPNRVRSLLGSFAMGNPVAFHQADGSGYALFFGQLAALDQVNPQIAARLGGVAARLPRLPKVQQQHLRRELEQLLAQGCSDNLHEVLSQILAG